MDNFQFVGKNNIDSYVKMQQDAQNHTKVF